MKVDIRLIGQGIRFFNDYKYDEWEEVEKFELYFHYSELNRQERVHIPSWSLRKSDYMKISKRLRLKMED